jgi:hypothetical protein
MLTVVIEWRQLGHGREREEERRGCILGYSILWCMYHLYGFDISVDLVHDVTHILSLNILKKYAALLVSTMEKVGQMPKLEITHMASHFLIDFMIQECSYIIYVY